MNLIDKKVTHKSFGIGRIAKCTDSNIEIHFATEKKLFVYPDVFAKHLELHDAEDAKLLEAIIEKKEIERKEELWQKEEDKKLQRKKQLLRWEHEKLMNHHKLHAESQLVYACDEEEKSRLLTEWTVFSGTIKSGANKGKPTIPVRLHQNSAVLLTTVDAGMLEKNRRILGVYMVKENFVGKLCHDGQIPAHSVYKLALTEQESVQLLFWNYYVNKKSEDKIAWKTGKTRYFDNIWMAQILQAIVSLKTDEQEKALAQQFFKHFCKMNQLTATELPEPNGALLRM